MSTLTLLVSMVQGTFLPKINLVLYKLFIGVSPTIFVLRPRVGLLYPTQLKNITTLDASHRGFFKGYVILLLF
jgi:hypothetical protein